MLILQTPQGITPPLPTRGYYPRLRPWRRNRQYPPFSIYAPPPLCPANQGREGNDQRAEKAGQEGEEAGEAGGEDQVDPWRGWGGGLAEL